MSEDRRYAAYYRTNNRTQWRYATYAGCWESEERAIAEVRDRLQGESGQYRIEDAKTGNVTVGSI